LRNVLTYGKLTKDELREELVELTSRLSATYSDLAGQLQDQQRDYLSTYARSPGNSVAAKNREAQYYCEDLTRQIIGTRATINALVLARDLIVFLFLSKAPDIVPFPEIASFDADGMVTV
jgi:hypothetical protein